MQTEKRCYISGRTDCLERHHVFGGPNRKLSEKYGLWVWLNHEYHNEPPNGVHFNRVARLMLQAEGQRAKMHAVRWLVVLIVGEPDPQTIFF